MKKREEINEEFKWKMEDVYQNESDWENDKNRVTGLFEELKRKKGTITKDYESFKSTISLMNELEIITERVYFYANQKFHEDLGNGKYQKMSDEASELLNNFCAASSFVEPEFLDAREEVVNNYLDNEDMKEYKHYFHDLFRQKEHILSSEKEEILAMTQNFSNGSYDIFSVFNNVDLKFGKVKDADGKEILLTHGNYSTFMESEDRKVRCQAFKALYKPYKDFKNTVAAVYINKLKKDSFYSKVRKYTSSRQMYLDGNNIPEKVYDNLVKVVDENLDKLHKYISLRKKVFGYDEVHMYDVYAPMVKDVNKHIEYEEAKEIVLKGLEPLGDEYLELLREGFDNRWIDVYENEGKRSGAYSWSTYGIHPYVLLNYQPDLNSVFTLAHEMGHALHSYYSNSNQTYTNAQYKIFVAEVASICNESLLIHYLINNAEDKQEKAFLINHFLEQFRTTLFRQTMFAEFEMLVHSMADRGEALNSDVLCEIYGDLNRKYFGEDIIIDDEIKMEWARIPHFYTSFYVYQYATGFSAAIALSKKIMEEGEPAVEKYKKFLKSGCSDYPIEILKAAGVDLSEETPLANAMDMFGGLLDEFEKLI